MPGGWEYIAAAWLITFGAIAAYAVWLHRKLAQEGEEEGGR